MPGGGYQGGFWSGTSMAGPHVAGLAALMWSVNKNLIGDIKTTIKIIQETAKPLKVSQSCGGLEGSAIPNNTTGHGMIDAYAAVKKAKAMMVQKVTQAQE
ncbi:S8 family serine peptidase [Bacteriovoracaceae bacterium]|nr:S8 family serine peptidase [Bacteriovoracaceae bacterium]